MRTVKCPQLPQAVHVRRGRLQQIGLSHSFSLMDALCAWHLRTNYTDTSANL